MSVRQHRFDVRNANLLCPPHLTDLLLLFLALTPLRFVLAVLTGLYPPSFLELSLALLAHVTHRLIFLALCLITTSDNLAVHILVQDNTATAITATERLYLSLSSITDRYSVAVAWVCTPVCYGRLRGGPEDGNPAYRAIAASSPALLPVVP